ncbi:hypothetical protein [Hymenobacter sp. BRD128]|uniref:hypothetical protein n=1 Tax=Hymenobacter sp. BRD128 TaxID=2675878 RepID=UPI00349F16C7
MLSASYTTVLANLLYTHSREFVGIYDVALGWFTQVNPWRCNCWLRLRGRVSGRPRPLAALAALDE